MVPKKTDMSLDSFYEETVRWYSLLRLKMSYAVLSKDQLYIPAHQESQASFFFQEKTVHPENYND